VLIEKAYSTGSSKTGDNSTGKMGVGDTVGRTMVPSAVLLGWRSEKFADICANGEMGPSPETGWTDEVGVGEGLAKSEPMVFASAVHAAYIIQTVLKKVSVPLILLCMHTDRHNYE
jgi:hypothetical protein